MQTLRLARILWLGTGGQARAVVYFLVPMTIAYVLLLALGGGGVLPGLAPVLPTLLAAAREGRRPAAAFVATLPLPRRRLLAGHAAADYLVAFAALPVVLVAQLVADRLFPGRARGGDVPLVVLVGAVSLVLSWLPNAWLRVPAGIAAMFAMFVVPRAAGASLFLPIAAVASVAALALDLWLRAQSLGAAEARPGPAGAPGTTKAGTAPGAGLRLPLKALRASPVGLFFVSQPLTKVALVLLALAVLQGALWPERMDNYFAFVVPLQLGMALGGFLGGAGAAFLRTRPLAPRRWMGAVVAVTLALAALPPSTAIAFSRLASDDEIARRLEDHAATKRRRGCTDREGCAEVFERAAARLADTSFGRFDRHVPDFLVPTTDRYSALAFVPGPGLVAQYRRMLVLKGAGSLFLALSVVMVVGMLTILKGTKRFALALVVAIPAGAAAWLATEIALSDGRTALLPGALLGAALVAAALLLGRALRRAEPAL